MFEKFKQKLKTKRNFKFGEDWEEDTREYFFTSEDYDLLEKTHNYNQNSKDYVKSSLNPDYKFKCIYTKKIFHIECKARCMDKLLEKNDKLIKKLYKLEEEKKYKEIEKLEKENQYFWKIDICPEAQFKRFKEINEKEKVLFFILFTERKTNFLEEDIICLVPISELLSNSANFNAIIDKFQVSDSEITPNKLWNNYLKYYGHKANCIRCQSKIKYCQSMPFCYNCWQDWFKYKKYSYEEKYCHNCGKEYKTTAAKPLCFECYNKFPVGYF